MSNTFDAPEEVPTTDVSTEDTANTVPSSTRGVSVETRTYRTYGVISDKGEFSALGANGKALDNPLVRAETADGKSWKSAEDNGNTKLTENQFSFYTLEDENAFPELIPDVEQRKYVINRGLSVIQTAKANQYQAEIDGTTGQFAYSDQQIDLRDALNETPGRQRLTDTQKIMRELSALDPAKKAEMLAALQAMMLG